jgi:hypothetical protein
MPSADRNNLVSNKIKLISSPLEVLTQAAALSAPGMGKVN